MAAAQFGVSDRSTTNRAKQIFDFRNMRKILKIVGSIILVILIITGWIVITLMQAAHSPYTLEGIFTFENITNAFNFYLFGIIIIFCIFLVWSYLKENGPQYFV